MTETVDAVAALRDSGENLSNEMRARILSEGSRWVAPLIDIVRDDDLALEDSPGEGWLPIHAVELLCEIGAPEAIEPFLDVLDRTDPDERIHDRIILRLAQFGEAALEPVLARLDRAHDRYERDGLCEILSRLGVRDERIFTIFGPILEEDPEYGAMLFSSYGDPRALPFVERAIDELRFDVRSYGDRRALIELVHAHRELGGELPAPLQARVDAWFAAVEKHRNPPRLEVPARSGLKIGRNDPCPCGSGKKYKKCCIGVA